jgi:hypothetical protein
VHQLGLSTSLVSSTCKLPRIGVKGHSRPEVVVAVPSLEFRRFCTGLNHVNVLRCIQEVIGAGDCRRQTL